MTSLRLNDKTTYSTFAEHPLAPLYFKYIDILISRDLNHDIQHLLDIANVPLPLSNENVSLIAEIISTMKEIAYEDEVNEFEELRHQLENPN